MNKQEYQTLLEWFETYTGRFYSLYSTTIQNIRIKYEHNKRVSEEILTIAKQFGLTGKELYTAEVIGLFHDIGRFKQYTDYNTFRDNASVDHGDLGVQVLRDNNVLDILPATDHDIIETAVRYHNKKSVPSHLKTKPLFYTKLIRDADKVDIYKVVTDYYQSGEENQTLVLDLPDQLTIDRQVVKDVLHYRLPDKERLTTVNDFKLLQISWIYDLNFIPSLEIVYNNGYLDIIFDNLPQNEDVEQIKSVVYRYVDKQLNSLNYSES